RARRLAAVARPTLQAVLPKARHAVDRSAVHQPTMLRQRLHQGLPPRQAASRVVRQLRAPASRRARLRHARAHHARRAMRASPAVPGRTSPAWVRVAPACAAVVEAESSPPAGVASAPPAALRIASAGISLRKDEPHICIPCWTPRRELHYTLRVSRPGPTP